MRDIIANEVRVFGGESSRLQINSDDIHAELLKRLAIKWGFIMKNRTILATVALVTLVLTSQANAGPKQNGVGQLMGEWSLFVDCYHSDLNFEDTDDKVKVELFNESGQLMYSGLKIIYLCSAISEDGDLFSIKTDAANNKWRNYSGRPAKIVLTATGDNAAFIDHLDLETYSDYSFFGGGDLIKRWGKDDGRGWCLSTDPDDINGAWKDYASGCHRTLTFTVD